MNDETAATASAAGCDDQPAGRPIPVNPDALLFTSEAAFLVALSPRTLEALRLSGAGPRFVALGRRAIRYRRRDLENWIAAHERRSTSDPGAGDGAAAVAEG